MHSTQRLEKILGKTLQNLIYRPTNHSIPGNKLVRSRAAINMGPPPLRSFQKKAMVTVVENQRSRDFVLKSRKTTRLCYYLAGS